MSMTPRELRIVIKELEKQIEQLKEENEQLKNNSVPKLKNERGAGRKSKINDDIIRTVKELRIQGKSIRAISKDISLAVGTVHRIIKDHIPPNE